jgi:choline kinase
MQAIIMAAGYGRRLEKLTNGSPKSYLKINGETLIERQLRLLREIGIDDIIIVTGYQKNRFETDFASQDVTFAFNPFYMTTNVLVSFWCAQHLLHGDFIYLHADTIFHEKIFKNLITADQDIVLPIDFKVCRDEDMKVKIVNNAIVKINKEMPSQTADGEFIGVTKIRSHVLRDLKSVVIKAMENNQFQSFFEHAIQELIDTKKTCIGFIPTDGFPWCEIDFEEDYQRAVSLFK